MLSRAAYPEGSNRLSSFWILGITLAVVFPSIVAQAAFDPPTGQRILPDDRRASEQFGISVAVDSSAGGGFLVVGAFRNDQIASDAGKAYVFRRGTSPWFQMDEIFAPDGEVFNQFGQAVAIDGDTIAIGAPAARKDANLFAAGAVYVFTYPGTGDQWIFQQKLTASDGANGDAFGRAVDIQGDTIAVGALEKDSGQPTPSCVTASESGANRESSSTRKGRLGTASASPCRSTGT